jgi:hypothetical protein
MTSGANCPARATFAPPTAPASRVAAGANSRVAGRAVIAHYTLRTVHM